MATKKIFRISYLFIITNIGVLYSSNGFCQQFSNNRSIDNVSNIEFDLSSTKYQESNSENRNHTAIYSKTLNELDSFSNAKKEKNYRIIQKNLKSLEIIYQALNVIDAVQTIGCMQKSGCQEKNPLFGSHPSVGKIIAIKSLAGIIHYAAYRHGIKQDNRLKYTLSMEIISIAVQGTVVGLNFRTII